MNTVFEQIKNVILLGIAHTGIDRLAVSLHRRDALVLVYHGIVRGEKNEPFRYHHTVAAFEAQLDWIGAHCTPVGLEGFARWKGGHWQPSKPPALITFDDGYRNNATTAAPLLARKRFPALFFINSGYVDSGRVLWPDEVFARTMAWNRPSLTDPRGVSRAVPNAPSAREALAFAMVEACKNCSDTERREFLAYLAAHTRHFDPMIDRDAQEMLSWDEVRALANAGFDIGSHTVSHPILSRLSPDDLRTELRDSRTVIQERTGSRCTSLAYPGGRLRDVTEAVLEATADAGYAFAFTVSDRWYARGGAPLLVDRISTPGHASAGTFALHVSGSRRWFPR